MPRITPCLWFETQAEEAARYYVSIFKNSKVGRISYYGEGAPMPKGTVLTVTFTLDGQEFMGLNGGPAFKFTEAVSFMVNCKTQKEIDRYWAKLSEGGREVECGWVKDRYGLSWQIVPAEIGKMIADKNPARASRVLQAVMGMKKLDLAALKKAYAGK
jgi:predicted 3-demethylubiquinone-9 3-methyltransferase (glyoxalase superfamily)